MLRSRVALACLAAATGAVLALDVTGVLPGPLSAALDTSSAPAPPVATGVTPRPQLVLAGLDSVASRIPSATAVDAAIAPLLEQRALGSSVTVSIVDVATGTPLVARDVRRATVPASTTKVVTAVTALTVLGPDTRLTTTVVAGPGNRLVLVGAGDPSLVTTSKVADTPTLAALAAATAQRVKTAGVSSVSVAFDDSLFQGPSTAPSWESGYVSSGIVAPVTALQTDGGRVRPGSDARAADPSALAARRFADLLRARGVTVTGNVARARADAASPVWAQVSSPPVRELVSTMLTDSNNDYAEALAHLSGARAASSGTFDGGARAATTVLGDLGVSTQGLRLADGSGLSRDNRLTAETLTTVLVRTTAEARAVLRPALTGLAVGALDGTLEERFDRPATSTGAGRTRAKTGTLTGVSTLAGVVVDVDDRQLAFAIMADAVPAGAGAAAETALDRIVAQLSRCGCA